MCRVGFLVFNDKLEGWEKVAFIVKLAAAQDDDGGQSQGFTFLKFSEDNSHWDYVTTYRILGAAETNAMKIFGDLQAVNPFDAVLMHNRMATHGGVNLENCHPIERNKFFVVHNGIFTGYTHFLKKGEVVTSWGNYTGGTGCNMNHEDDFHALSTGTPNAKGLSDTAIAARLISEEGLEVFKRVLIGSGTYLWYDGKEKVVRGVKTGYQPLDLFAMVKGEEPMIWGMVSNIDDLPKDTNWTITKQVPLLGEILTIDARDVRRGTEGLQLIAKHSATGQLYELIPQGMFRKQRLFDDEDLPSISSTYRQDWGDANPYRNKYGQSSVWDPKTGTTRYLNLEEKVKKEKDETSPLEDDEGWQDPDKEIEEFWGENP